MKEREPLGPHTTFRIGGEARYWYEPQNERELVRFLEKGPAPCPLFVIGAGSNLLVKEGLINRIFLHLSRPSFTKIKIQGDRVHVGAGAKIGRLVSCLHSQDLGGYEFLAGIPGTIGGALAMNAGARNDFDQIASWREMKDILVCARVCDRSGRVRRLPLDAIKFSYRHARLEDAIILSAELRLVRADKKSVQARIRHNLTQRLAVQDWFHPSAGSFFKNPGGKRSAGALIDLCGLKGFKVGGAQVSPRHANFIINARGASSSDVIKLMEIIRNKVYNRFKIKLIPEVEIVA
jgi:UDP-N-acetylmuramate dehydrogenase